MIPEADYATPTITTEPTPMEKLYAILGDAEIRVDLISALTRMVETPNDADAVAEARRVLDACGVVVP